MPTLSSNIVKLEIASVRDVEEALARQALYGGDLATNLLELSSVSEEQLTRVIAESVELEPAPVGELPASPDHVRRFVPGDVAQRYLLYPLEESSGTLIVAVSEPLPPEVTSDLEFSLGLGLSQRATTRIRVEQAIARDYGMKLDQRVERLLAQLAGKPDPHPTEPPPRLPETPAEPSNVVSIDAARSEDSWHGASRTESGISDSVPNDASTTNIIRAPAPAASAATSTSLLESAAQGDRVTATQAKPRALPKLDLAALARAERTPARKRRRLGPYTAAMAERDLLDAESRDEVVSAFFDFAAQYFDYCALFQVHGELAEGRDAYGSGAPRNKVRGIGVPLDLPSTLASAINADSYRLARLSASGLDGALIKDLERRPGPAVLLLPIRVRGRSVLVLYGDHGENDVELAAVGNVIAFAPLVASALERAILRRKGQARDELLPAAHAARASRLLPEFAKLPSKTARAEALAQALEAGPRHADENSRPSSSPSAASVPPYARPVISVGPGRRTTPRGVSVHPGAVEANTTVTVPVTPSFAPLPAPRAHPPLPSRSRTPVPSSFAPGAPPHSPIAPPPRLGMEAPPVSLPPEDLVDDNGWEEIVPGDSTAEDMELRASSRPSPELSLGVTALDEPLDELGEEEPTVPGAGVPFAPLSRSLAYSARPPPMPGSSKELRLPAVIVDLAHDTEDLVSRLVKGDQRAADRLVEIGAAAVPALVGAFPGPIVNEPRRSIGDVAPKASDAGPLLNALARIGTKAAGVLSVRSNDKDPNVRAWATRLLGEMPCLDSARAVARRFIDDDVEVRRSALAAARLLQASVGSAGVLAGALTELLLDTVRQDRLQHMVIEAIADLREARAIPALASLLSTGSREIQRSAHWALIVLTRTDFGDDSSAWEDWWRKNQSRHRIEWLIDALMQDNQEIRRAAGDELKSLTKEYFGYYDDLPARERERAQQRYRDWWHTKGKSRFS